MFNAVSRCPPTQAALPQLDSIPSSERARKRELESYLTAASIDADLRHLGDGTPPIVSKDPTLTALVQLGALRLDCDRSFLSLIDGSTQWIVAEATRTTSLVEKDGGSGGDPLSFGVIALDMNFGVCPNTMKVFTDSTDSAGVLATTSNITADKSRFIIHDFHADPHYVDKPYIKEFPFMRSYAEVPIISPHGYVIGGYCVVDNKLRNFDDFTIKVLTEISSTIMTHLEHVRIKHNFGRSERLVRGLDTFIQDDSTLQGTRRSSSSTTTSVYSTGSQSTPSFSPSTNAPKIQAQTLQLEPFNAINEPVINEPTKDTIESVEVEVRRAFERSASLIQSSMDVDGLVFLDACPVGFTSRQPQALTPGIEHPFLSFEPTLDDSSSSTRNSPVFASSISNPQHANVRIPEALLYRLIRRYKQGQIFSADDQGFFKKRGINHSPTREDSFLTQDYYHTEQLDADDLFRCIPQACSIIFLPLWHFQKGKWFAAAVGWTSDRTLSFDRNDTTFLNAFCNSIMFDILRLETLAISKAKSDFISSISHELRSPLHGILATTELLHTISQRSPEELTLINMVKSCGNTLLDTMNHLLDYAKINSLAITRNQKAMGGHNLTRGDLRKPMNAVDLALLVEEVVESVMIGFRYDHEVGYQTKTTSTSMSKIHPSEDNHADGVPIAVITNIQPHRQWSVLLDNGGWKRIVMNLFGNALKYTKKGKITIELDIVSHSSGDQIRFRIRDTGIGISGDYQKYRLFTAFSQEDSLAKGSGLGLHIVQQIVTSMNGNIDVESAQGKGTEVTVLVPYPKATSLHTVTESPLEDETYKLQGLTLAITSSDSPPIGNVDSSALEYQEAINASLASIATKWFNMRVVTGPLADLDADIYVVDRSLDNDSEPTALPIVNKPLVVLRAAHCRIGTTLFNGTTLRLPIGPRRLGTALVSALLKPKIQALEATVDLTHQAESITPDSADPWPQKLPTPDSEVKVDLFPQPLIHPEISITPTSVKSPPPVPKSQLNHHVLVVDDNLINLKILTTLVKRLGCTFRSAKNGLEAVEQFQKSTVDFPFTIIFMDISMPVMDGYEATRRIRATELEENRIPTNIVALTGLGSPVSEKEAYLSGVDLFLTKPISIDKLEQLLRKRDDSDQ